MLSMEEVLVFVWVFLCGLLQTGGYGIFSIFLINDMLEGPHESDEG